MKELRLGVIGIGNMGSVHVRTIQGGKVDRLKVTALSDSRKEKSGLFPDLPFYENPDDLIADSNVDAVLVATPHYDHTILGKKVLEAGKHLLLEKPISVHKADCLELIAAHTDKSIVFAAMFNQRTDPRYQKIKELIETGQLGEIRRVVWEITDWFRTESYYASGGWRATWKGREVVFS